MRWIALLALLLLGCGDDPDCPSAPDGGYQPGDKIHECDRRFTPADAHQP